MYHTCYDNQDLDTRHKGNESHALVGKPLQRIKVSNFKPMWCKFISVYFDNTLAR